MSKRQVGQYGHCQGTRKWPTESSAYGWANDSERGTCSVCGKRVRLDKYGYVGGHSPAPEEKA